MTTGEVIRRMKKVLAGRHDEITIKVPDLVKERETDGERLGCEEECSGPRGCCS